MKKNNDKPLNIKYKEIFQNNNKQDTIILVEYKKQTLLRRIINSIKRLLDIRK